MGSVISRSEREWSNLPGDILTVILHCLNNTDTERTRLRGVCKSWRSALHRRLLPDKLPFPRIDDSDTHIGLFVPLIKSALYIISIPQSWYQNDWHLLVRANDKDFRLQRFLCPDKFMSHNVMISLFENDIREIAQSYSLATYYYASSGRSDFENLPGYVRRVVVGSKDWSEHDLAVLALSGIGLSLWKPGNEQWVDISGIHHPLDYPFEFDDIIYFKGKFYAVSAKGYLISIDPKNFDDELVVSAFVGAYIPPQEENYYSSTTNGYLLESEGLLYLIISNKKNGKMIRVQIFVLKNYSGSNYHWSHVGSLNGRMFFITAQERFALSAQELGFERGDRVYFTPDYYCPYGGWCNDDESDGDYDEVYKEMSHKAYHDHELALSSRFSDVYCLKTSRCTKLPYYNLWR